MILTICRDIMHESNYATIHIGTLAVLAVVVFLGGFYYPGRDWKRREDW